MHNTADFDFLLRNLLAILAVGCLMAGVFCAAYVPAIRKRRRDGDTGAARRYTAILFLACAVPLVVAVACFAPLLWRLR